MNMIGLFRQNSKIQKEKNLKSFLWVIIIFASAWGTYKSVFYGNDIDESYAITQAYRLVIGDRLFSQMWEVHQTSAFFMAPFIYIYRLLAGNTIGMVLFLRIVGCFLLAAVSIFFFFALREYINDNIAGMIAVIVYNYTPKYLQVLEFCMLEYIFAIALAGSILIYVKTQKTKWVFAIAICLAGCVLAYPMIVMVAPIVIWLICLITDKNDRKKVVGILIITDIALAAFFIGYILNGISVLDFTRNISYILQDGAHQISLGKKMTDGILEYAGLQKYSIAGMIVMEIVALLYRNSNREKIIKNMIPLFILLCLMGGFIFMLYTGGQEGIRFIHLSYWVYSVFPGLIYLNYRIPEFQETKTGIGFKSEDKVFGIITCIMFLVFIIAYLQSNMDMYSNGGLLLPALLIQLALFCMKYDGEIIQKVCIVYLLLLFLFFRCVCIRFTSVQAITVFDKMYKTEVGPLKGIYQTQAEHIMYHSKLEAIQKNVSVDDTLLILGSDTYLYFFVGNNIGTPSTISTPVFGDSFVEYFKLYPDKKPSIVALDKYSYNYDRLLENESLYDWLERNYDIANPIDSYYLEIYRSIEKDE